MFIDTYEIPYSYTAMKDTTRRMGGISTNKVIAQLCGLLELVGWHKTKDLYANGRMDAPLGYPFTNDTVDIPHKTHVGCGATMLNFKGVKFSLYNPHSEIPDLAVNCVMVPLGNSPLGTLGNIASAFNVAFAGAHPPYGAKAYADPVVAGNLVFEVTGLIGGPEPNFPYPFTGDGRWGTSGSQVNGGGWTYTSLPVPSQNGGAGGGSYDVTITGIQGFKGVFWGQPADDGMIQMEFKMNGTKAIYTFDTWTLEGVSQFLMYANPYSFCIFDPDRDNHFLCNTSIWAFAPDTTGFASVGDCAVVIAPGKFRNTTSFWSSCTVMLNSSPVTFNDGPYPRPIAFRWPLTPMLSPDLVPAHYCVYIMVGIPGTNPTVVGRLYDCMMASDYVSSGLVQNELKYDRISAQNGNDTAHYSGAAQTVSSVLMQYVSVVDPTGNGTTPAANLVQVVGGSPGMAWTYDITVPFGDPGDPIVISVYGTLPTGVSVTQDAGDHRIIHIVSTGTPEGDYNFTISANMTGFGFTVSVMVAVHPSLHISRESTLTPVQGAGDGALWYYYETDRVSGGSGSLYQWYLNDDPMTYHLPPNLPWDMLSGEVALGSKSGFNFYFRAQAEDVGTWFFSIKVVDEVYLSDPTQTAHMAEETISFTIPSALDKPALMGSLSGAILQPVTIGWHTGQQSYFIAGVMHGVPPYVFYSTGTLPPGMTFDPNQGYLYINGTPSAGGTYNFSIYVIDANGNRSDDYPFTAIVT